jgi:S1-C subfamily serine protease
MMAKKYFLLITALALPFFARGVGAEVSSGTAFAVAPGLLITNHHVVARCSSVDVVTTDGRRGGSVLDADAQIDFALLRVSGIPSATARLRSPRNIRLGESVTVFGFPLTGSLSSGGNFTTGVVSALRGFRDAPGALQITAPVQSGNSGGPLMDASGLVIGVVQAKLDALRSAVVTGDRLGRFFGEK